jgi:rSAM/selenodomain-associated transferase 2
MRSESYPVHSLSVIIPTLNEAESIGETLGTLEPLRARGAEVVVVDGGSTDGTWETAAPLADRVIHARRGRAVQQNAGAAIARGEVVLFLHADTRLPDRADEAVQAALDATGGCWGRFDVRLSGSHPLLRVLERLISLRSRLSGIATGDQAIFVRRECFQRIGGFPQIPLMEDVALSRLLKKRAGRPVCIRQPVVTSSRRWERRGIARTILLMWRLRFEYWLGADPLRLAERYR